MFKSFYLMLLALFSRANNNTINIKLGDITNAKTEAIVNAANKDLLAGGGVCGAIFNAAGINKLQDACDNLNGCSTGEAKITPAFGLTKNGIKYIIHAVGPDCRIVKDEKEQDILLENAYKNSLELANKVGIKSISFPFISSAIYAFPKERATKIAIKTVKEFVKNNKNIKQIDFVLFSQEDYTLFIKTLKNS